MEWLRDRIHGRRRNQRPEPAGEPPVPESPAPEPAIPDFDRPRLVLLVHDAAGPATYQLHSFEDEAEAAAFVQFWFPADIDHGVIAFWASHREPEVEAGERPAEVVVLIRGDNRPKTVYPFSFAGMDLARSWLARESNRELDPDQMLIYWALPARISRDHWGRAHFWPSEPPPLRRDGRKASPAKPVFQREPPSPPRAEPQPPEHEETHLEEEPPELPFEAPAEASAIVEEHAPESPFEPPVEASAIVEQEPPELPFETPAEASAIVEEEPPELPFEMPVEASATVEEEPPELPFEMPVEASATVEEEPPEFPFETPAEASTVVEEEPPQLPFEAPAEERAGDRPSPPKKAKPRRGSVVLDPDEEIDELLDRSRWEKREGPFRGFGSPPGKF
jgi:hypothetical protein